MCVLRCDSSRCAALTVCVQLRLDGTIEIVTPNSDTMVVPLSRLTRLLDSVEQLEELWGDDEGTIDEEGEDVENQFGREGLGCW